MMSLGLAAEVALLLAREERTVVATLVGYRRHQALAALLSVVFQATLAECCCASRASREVVLRCFRARSSSSSSSSPQKEVRRGLHRCLRARSSSSSASSSSSPQALHAELVVLPAS